MEKESFFLSKFMRFKWTPVFLGLFWTCLIFCTITVSIPFLSPLINHLDHLIYDQMVQLNGRPHPTNPQVVIIDIDDYSVQREGRWPWPRNKMADLVNKLKQKGVVTIGLDIVMADPEVNSALILSQDLNKLPTKLNSEEEQLRSLLLKIAPQVDHDQMFADSLLDHNVVLGYLFHNNKQVRKGVLPPPLSTPQSQVLYRDNLSLHQFKGYDGCLKLFLDASTQAGSVTNLPDSDGVIRHGLMVESYKNELYASSALSIAMNYLLVEQVILKTQQNKLYGIQIGGVFIPTNPFGQILIPFWGQPGTLIYYSATDILQDKITANELQGSIAVIGSTMILLGDLHESPAAQLFPGVEMVGNMIQGIISQQLVAQYDWGTAQAKIYLILIGLFFTFLFSFLSLYFMLLAALIIIMGILGLSVFLFVSKSLYIPLALILILIIFLTITNYVYLFIIESRQKRKINQLFGQYVPEDYVKELVELPDQSSMEGQERNMTVLFIDIRSFTSISEDLDASSVKQLLNTFFTPITEIIFSFRGTIDKYVGDMIVAFWGAPIQDEEHAYHAINCSLSIVKQLPEINATMRENNLPAVNIGVGLATGLMNVGDMGSAFRRSYTVIGDTVNLASRLQDLTKFYQITILVSDGTRIGQDQFVWRTVDKITVKGRKTGLTIYQPLGKVDELSEELRIELEEYHKALYDYYAQNWSSAEKKFAMLKTKPSNLYLYQIYLERIKVFRENPPPSNWNGIYIHHFK